jgi:signal transduction histidine kinase
MPRRLLFALLLLVAAPLVLLGWVSATSMRQQREVAERQLRNLLTSRLIEIDRSLGALFDEYVRQLAEAVDKPGRLAENLRELKLTNPLVRQGIVVSANGVMVHPPKPVADDPDGIALYAALSGLIDSRPQTVDSLEDAIPPTKGATMPSKSKLVIPDSSSKLSSSVPSRSPKQDTSQRRIAVAKTSERGSPLWQVWYMDEGSQLILWIHRGDGAAVGILLERVRWVADMTAALPDTVMAGHDPEHVSPTPGFTALLDEAREIVYRWGDEGAPVAPPLATIPLSAPLNSWRLAYHADSALVPRDQPIALFASLTGIGVLLIALGAFVLTSVGRQMRTARNRVSFAGQVSHELRTPLTNIRLYAELAENDLQYVDEGDARKKLAHRLSVIDAESRRLGRLVSGVLEMIRDDRKQRGPRVVAIQPDQVIDQTLKQFAPSFANVGIELHRDADATDIVGLDADILEMVLVNLLSNVEKYASDGQRIDVESRLVDNQLFVTIQDYGPGIPRRKHGTVFRAFSRLDDSINAPSGTGIGLTIARSAAKRHGGDLRLVASEKGARFELRIPVTL